MLAKLDTADSNQEHIEIAAQTCTYSLHARLQLQLLALALIGSLNDLLFGP